MPRHAKGPRLHRHANGIWCIRDDGGYFRSTGTRERRQAETTLAEYIARKDRTTGPTAPHQMTVAAALDIYATERAPTARDPVRIGYAIAALAPILVPLPVASLNGAVCRRYAKQRAKAPGTVRRELGTLQAAFNYCHAEGYLTSAPKVTLPAKTAPRDRWLTRDEAAKLLRAAYRNPKARHLAHFILVALYTGSRAEAILRLRFMPSTDGGWIDVKAGRMYRRGSAQTESKKRTPPIPVPRALLAHLRRWERNGARFAVEVDGQRVGSLKTAWRTALAEAGIDHCTRHDLRRTAITWAMQAGIDKWAASGFYGVSLDILGTTYGHHHPDHLQGALDAINRRARI